MTDRTRHTGSGWQVYPPAPPGGAEKSGAGTATAFVTFIHRKVAYLPDKPVDNSSGPDKVPASNDDRRQTAGMHKKRPRAELTKNGDVFTILDIYPVKRKE
ncbi:hypothetical protein DRE43_19475 [Salmonella enterica subsp. enterica serovar Java]|nr:hypothetical protein [Salmonella enterica]EBX2066810.1 hypothetical protein [Salmonella enterica subsp. enterica serovar Java]